MADVTIAAGAVTCRTGDPVLTKVAQVAISGGQAVYEDQANGGKFNLCDGDAQASARMKGIAVSDAAAGEHCTIALPGAVITTAGGASFTKGVVYYVSLNAGGLAPFADIGAGDFFTLAVLALSTTTALVLGIISETSI